MGDYYGEVTRRYSQIEAAPPTPPEQAPADEHDEAAPAQVIHTALCIEARQGRLHIFLPPLTDLEHYLELMAAIEASAAACDLPVVLEGYEPPRDGRLERLAVTPDPGVIEVNIHPAPSWDALVENTTTLYALARQARLGTEKFMLDGRHTGTGGGNHITLGAATPTDSPVLRRPDLLRSLLTYWQHHPGLSFLFSGLFIGPTSQAPRVDEARHDSLYELDIAFQQMPTGESPAPWLVDRLLRNLLVDLTGNTHRAEFCIDKLYAPGSASGRLGLVELRAFEMPPHAQMSLFQALLLRALVARFWHAPYRQPLVRWGSGLHDRFMLPHYVTADLRAVLAELRQAGYPFQDDWLDPFVEFRFPRYGTVQVGDLTLELRAALEKLNTMTSDKGRFGRFFGRTPAGTPDRRHRWALSGDLQRPTRAAAINRHPRRAGGRRALPGLESALGAASDHRPARAAGAGHHRHLERPRRGRLHLSCSPSGRAQLRHLPDQCLRGRGSSHHAFLELRAHARCHHAPSAAGRTGPPVA